MLLWWLLLMVFLAEARAQTWGRVELLWAPDADGRLQEVSGTPEARRVRADLPTDLAVGLDLAVGDRVETDRAQARLRMDDGDQQIILGEDTVLVVTEDRTILHEVGEALYRVRGTFRVRYSSVEAAVEGTLFRVVVQDGTMMVEVLDGEVRVQSQGEEIRLRRDQQSAVVLGSAPTAPSPAGERPVLPPPGDLRRGVGDSRYSLGVMAGLSSYEDGRGLLPDGLEGGQGVSWRLLGSVRLSPRWRAIGEAGTVTASGRFLIPVSLGAERRWGPWRLGLSGAGMLGPCACADAALDVRLGGAGGGGLSLPLPVGLSLESRGRLGITTSVRGLEPPELLYDLVLGVAWSP